MTIMPPKIRRNPKSSVLSKLTLPDKIEQEVIAWRNQGYHPFPSETTRQLLRHWFDREFESGEKFHDCQRKAIETIIYCHEIALIHTLHDLFEKFAPELLKLSKTIADESTSIPFAKYCLKMATGSGKTWVLHAIIIWQYFNFINHEERFYHWCVLFRINSKPGNQSKRSNTPATRNTMNSSTSRMPSMNNEKYISRTFRIS